MYQIKPIQALTACEIKELAHGAADRGEDLEQSNPYKQDPQRAIYAMAFVGREHELQMTA